MRGDGSIWSQESGDGPLVVLVHGAMDRSGGMLRVRRELVADHRVSATTGAATGARCPPG